MCKDEGIKNTHYHNSILKASWENLGNQVVKRMASPWQICSKSPDRGEAVFSREGIHCNEKENRVRPNIQLHISAPLPQCETVVPHTSHCKECEE